MEPSKETRAYIPAVQDEKIAEFRAEFAQIAAGNLEADLSSEHLQRIFELNREMLKANTLKFNEMIKLLLEDKIMPSEEDLVMLEAYVRTEIEVASDELAKKNREINQLDQEMREQYEYDLEVIRAQIKNLSLLLDKKIPAVRAERELLLEEQRSSLLEVAEKLFDPIFTEAERGILYQLYYGIVDLIDKIRIGDFRAVIEKAFDFVEYCYNMFMKIAGHAVDNELEQSQPDDDTASYTTVASSTSEASLTVSEPDSAELRETEIEDINQEIKRLSELLAQPQYTAFGLESGDFVYEQDQQAIKQDIKDLEYRKKMLLRANSDEAELRSLVNGGEAPEDEKQFFRLLIKTTKAAEEATKDAKKLTSELSAIAMLIDESDNVTVLQNEFTFLDNLLTRVANERRFFALNAEALQTLLADPRLSKYLDPESKQHSSTATKALQAYKEYDNTIPLLQKQIEMVNDKMDTLFELMAQKKKPVQATQSFTPLQKQAAQAAKLIAEAKAVATEAQHTIEAIKGKTATF